MRISGLLGAVIALSMLTPSAPAHAYTISTGDLMVTDLFRWQGQDGAPTWREILAKFDGTEELAFYLWNVPSPPPPVVIPATTPVIDPLVAASSANPSGGAVDPLDPLDPIGMQGGDDDSSIINLGSGFVGLANVGDGAFLVGVAVPEPSTWAMMLLGFAGLAFAGYHQAKRASPARA
jgi:PEP-CTERM motif